jgi:hypothetical protein
MGDGGWGVRDRLSQVVQNGFISPFPGMEKNELSNFHNPTQCKNEKENTKKFLEKRDWHKGLRLKVPV